ncbi:unnamed protein product [Linum trigynum]|uniref:Uncharacterized protein n=1 Tax=Linum trigynum TaxID=586398 RepID=A0AAV2EFR1_9ROSI
MKFKVLFYDSQGLEGPSQEFKVVFQVSLLVMAEPRNWPELAKSGRQFERATLKSHSRWKEENQAARFVPHESGCFLLQPEGIG